MRGAFDQSDGHINAYRNGNSHSDAHVNAYRDGNSHSDAHAYRNCHAHANANTGGVLSQFHDSGRLRCASVSHYRFWKYSTRLARARYQYHRQL